MAFCKILLKTEQKVFKTCFPTPTLFESGDSFSTPSGMV